MGEPEALNGGWSGWWNRRITKQHRLTLSIYAGAIEIARRRFHYKELAAQAPNSGMHRPESFGGNGFQEFIALISLVGAGFTEMTN